MNRFFTIFFATALMVFSQNAYSETAPAPSQEEKLMIDAATKLLDGSTALLNKKQDAANKAFAEAGAFYTQVLEKDPTNVSALNGRGISNNYIQAGSGNDDLKKAIEISTEVIKADPNNAQAYYDRATSYRAKKMYDFARGDYAAAISLQPSKKNWEADVKAMEAEAVQETPKTENNEAKKN